MTLNNEDTIIWEKVLKKYINKPIEALEIKSHNGEITKWLIENILKNNNSLIYSLDIWEKNYENRNLSRYSNIEEEYDVNLSKFNNKNIKIVMNTYNALNKFMLNNNIFDFIFINTNYIDNLKFDIIILCWNILKINGIIIFNDYNLDNPTKTTIDSFMFIFKSEIRVLYKKKDLIIEKIEINKINDKLNKLVNKINNFIIIPFKYKIDTDIKNNLKFNIKTSKNPLDYDINEDNKDYLSFMEEDYFILNDKYSNINFNFLLGGNKKYILEDFFPNDIVNRIIKEDTTPFDLIKKLRDITNQNLDIPFYESLIDIKNNNLINYNDIINISIINFNHTSYRTNIDNIISNINKTYNNNSIKLYEINVTMKLLSNQYLKNIIYSRMENCNQISNNTELLNDKIDIILISLTSYNFIMKKQYNYEKYFTIQLFYQILFSLCNQKKNGCTVMISFTFFNDITIQLIFILKKYYEGLYFTEYKCSNAYTTSTKLIAYKFKDINENELNEIKKICEKIKVSKYDDYKNNKYIYFKSIINTNSKEYKNFKNEIIKMNKIKYENNYRNIKIFRDIIYYFETEKEQKEINKLKIEIIKKQIKTAYEYINIYMRDFLN